MKAKLLFLLAALMSVATAHAATPANFYDGAHARIANADMTDPKLGVAAGQGSSGFDVLLSWTASTSAASCVAPCSFGYNVYRGTVAGGESSTPLNAAPLTATTYTDNAITLGSSPTTFFYVVKAVETQSGVTVASTPSNEASATFPGVPLAPTALSAVPQ